MIFSCLLYTSSHLVKELGAEVTVLRNDAFQLEELEKFDKIILSPGPGIPSEDVYKRQVFRRCELEIPVR